MGCCEYNLWRAIFFMCLQETAGAEAPLITRFQPTKPKFGSWCGQIVSEIFRKSQKLICHHNAYGMAALIFVIRIARPITEKPGDRIKRARNKRCVIDVTRRVFVQKCLLVGLDPKIENGMRNHYSLKLICNLPENGNILIGHAGFTEFSICCGGGDNHT